MRTVAIVQARMGGTRLPGKVLAEAAGKPLLQHMIERLKRCETLDEIIVATPEKHQAKIWNLCAYLDVPSIGPSVDENDVLSRVLRVARIPQANVGVIVELTADCPLIDPAIVDQAVERLRVHRALEVSPAFISTSRPSLNPRNVKHAYPPGMDVRVFATETLAEVDRLTQDPADREHVSLYIWEHPRRYWCHDFLAPEELRDDVRLTVDTIEDLDLVRKIFDHFAPRNDFSLAEILAVLGEHPTWRKINESVEQKAVR